MLDRDLHQAAFARLPENTIDALARQVEPRCDGVLGLPFLELMPADPGRHGRVKGIVGIIGHDWHGPP